MATKTIYCMQAFWQDGRKLSKGVFRQFSKEEQARQAAEAAAKRNAGAIAFVVEGDPEFDCWGDPRLLAQFREVPDLTV